ncbi:MAG: hypothetical protein ACLT3C_00165 [Peptococcus niger]
MAKKKRRVNPRRRVMTQAEVNRAKKNVLKYANISSLVIAMMAAHDAFGFGPIRLERLMERMILLYKDYDQDLFTLEEARQWLMDYAKLDVWKED